MGVTYHQRGHYSPINLCPSKICTEQMSSTLMQKSAFNKIDHHQVMAEGQPATIDAKDTVTDAVCDTIAAPKGPYEAKILLCIGKSRRWVNIVHTSLSSCCQAGMV